MCKAVQKLDQISDPDLDLREDICGSGVTNGKFLELMCANCTAFEERRGQSKVKKVCVENCKFVTVFVV